MSRQFRGVEWVDRASDSRYPLIPRATVTDEQGVFEIPNEFLVSLYIAVPADLLIKPGYVYVSQILHTSSTVTVWISAEIGGSFVRLGRFELSQAAVRLQTARVGYGLATFIGETDYADLRGRITIGSLDNLALQPYGQFDFDYEAAGIETDCIRPHLRHISAVEVESGGVVSRLTGPIRLASGNNTRLRVEIEDGEPVIYVDAIDTTGLNEELECDYGTLPAIKTINGITGDSQRAITIVPSRCIEIENGDAELFLRNRCSEPCASCDEAEAVRDLILPFAQQVPTLIGTLNRLDAVIQQTQTSVLLSRGGQGECASGGGDD